LKQSKFVKQLLASFLQSDSYSATLTQSLLQNIFEGNNTPPETNVNLKTVLEKARYLDTILRNSAVNKVGGGGDSNLVPPVMADPSGRSPAEIVISNPTGGMDVSLL
jgi:hypothetical protein